MDRAWASKQLDTFRNLIDALFYFDDDNQYLGHDEDLERLDMPYQEVLDRLVVLEPVMRDLMEVALPGLGNYTTPPDGGWSLENKEYWRQIARPRALQAIGIHTLGAEAKEKMRPDSPDLAADQLHSWVWKAASPLWEAGSSQEAVHAAARSVNARLQQKLSRRDLADAKLCREAFSLNDAIPGQPRLRFTGDRTSETWRSRQNGGIQFGAGCFEGIRNPAAHEHRLQLSVHVALEQLAAFSLLARWIDECEVEKAG
jgi:hypothetical protein